MHLQINPGFRIVPHSEDHMQIGIAPDEYYLVSTPTHAHEKVLEELRSGIDFQDLCELVEQLGMSLDALKTLLAECEQVLLRTPYIPLQPEAVFPAERFWQAANKTDRSTLSKLRAESSVFIHGLHYSGTLTALTLGEAGIRKIFLCDEHHVQTADISYGLYGAEHRGLRRSSALKYILEQRFPHIRCFTKNDFYENMMCDLALDFRKYSYPQDFALRMMHQSIPQLYIQHQERTASIGPLVIPGESSCVNCYSLAKEDSIPGWRDLQEQLNVRNKELERLTNFFSYEEKSTAITVAGLASIHALLFLDGFSLPSSINSILTVDTERGEVLAQDLDVHDNCYCSSASLMQESNSVEKALSACEETVVHAANSALV
ncbi:MAG: hypothetical protein QM632_02910 [Micrococcaceae bacterium]